MQDEINQYCKALNDACSSTNWLALNELGQALIEAWKHGRQIFLCGNGGSAANAVHIANDWVYAVSRQSGNGLRAHALPANTAVMTCLANDEGYDKVFSIQLSVLACPGDILIVLSGSGNSPNIINALNEAKQLEMTSYAMLGFDGGEARELADHSIHFPINDMQIAEDLQLISGHILMKFLSKNKDSIRA
ncbi:SIS domain-containing protein [Alphaproteobacteria bacterium]|nr:SIS domain-containing protein [Alphaproteobacteria bacterium]